MNKQEYQEYLKSERWATLREAVFERADYRCQLCDAEAVGSVVLHCHHRSYADVGHGHEICDLIALCETCHSKHHDKFMVPRAEWIENMAQVDVDAAEWNGMIAQILTRRAEILEERKKDVDG